MSKKSKRRHDKSECLSFNDQYELMQKQYPDAAPQISVEPGVFLGETFFADKGTYIGLPLGSDGHIIVVGGTGRGKTTCIVMPTMKTWTAPMIVTDIKGELSAHYEALYQEGLVDRPYLVFDPMSDEGLGYDPFWWVIKDDPSNLVNNMREIAYAIIPDGPNVNDKYWYDCERGVLIAALLYYYNLGISFSDSICKISSMSITELCKKLKSSDDISIKQIIDDIGKLKAEQLVSISQGIHNRISVFVTDSRTIHAFRSSQENSDCFTWDDIQTKNIFLKIPEERIEQWEPVINLLYSQLIRYLERRPEKHSIAGAAMEPVLLLMDEFARFGKLEMFTNAISTLRSKKVNICIVVQSLAQMDMHYGVHKRRIIMDNCEYVAILGANDSETRNYLSELIGTETVMQKSKSVHMDDDRYITGYSTQTNEVRKPMILPEELSRMKDIILISRYGVQRIPKHHYHDISQELYHFNIKPKPSSEDIEKKDEFKQNRL